MDVIWGITARGGGGVWEELRGWMTPLSLGVSTEEGGGFWQESEGVDVIWGITARGGGGVWEELRGWMTPLSLGVSTEEGGGFWQESEDTWGVTAEVEVEGVLLRGAAENMPRLWTHLGPALVQSYSFCANCLRWFLLAFFFSSGKLSWQLRKAVDQQPRPSKRATLSSL